MRSVFNEVGYADMTYTSAALSWTEDLGAREILLTATGEADIHRVLSDEEIREMQAVVTDLKAGVKIQGVVLYQRRTGQLCLVHDAPAARGRDPRHERR